ATAILFAVMVLAVVWQVFTREVTQSPAAWTEELARYVFVWTALVGATLVFSERGHIAVSFVVDRLPLPVRKLVAVLIQLVILLFAVVILVIGGAAAAQNTWTQQLTALPGTIGQAYLVLPITGVMIALIAIVNAVEDLRGQGPLTRETASTPGEVPDVPGIEDAAAGGLVTEEAPPWTDGDAGTGTRRAPEDRDGDDDFTGDTDQKEK